MSYGGAHASSAATEGCIDLQPIPEPEAPHAGASSRGPSAAIAAAAPQDDRAPTALQVVDANATRAKYDAELAEYRELEVAHRRRGWWLLDATFPRVLVAFTTPQLRPPAVVCGVDIDFTNFDVEPPSVRLVDPFTREPYQRKDLPTSLFRRQLIQVPFGGGVQQVASHVELMQAHDPQEVPFLCIPGVREYHAHPAHTGDSWFLHRGLGAGKLYHILNTIYQYGVQPIASYGIGLRVVGFEQGEPPL